MFKNVASKFIVFAFDVTTGAAKTGDAANITAYVSLDYGSVTALGDTSAAEMQATNAPGYYLFDAAQGETNADCILVSAKSATANISVMGAPAVIYTRPTTGWLAPTTAGRTLDVSAGGEAGVDWANVGTQGTAVNLSGTTVNLTNTVTTYTGNTVQTGDSFARIGVAGAGLTNINLPDQTMNITGDITGNLSGSVGSVTGLTAANLDATISSRMATYTQPTGFLTATFPAGTIANTTNITAGTMTTTTNLTTNNDKTGYELSATGSAVLTESYAADGGEGTLAQILYLVQAYLTEKSISGTTLTANKLDGATPAATFTLDSATAPTSITRAT